jgi:hypothetical protein
MSNTGNIIRRVAKNRKEMEDINKELTGETLKNIVINQKIINFGKLFVKSREERDFVV